MSEATSHAERLEELDPAAARAERIRRGNLAHQAKVSQALTLYESMGEEGRQHAALSAEVREIARKALPAAMRRVAAVALGKFKAAESTRLEATRMLAGAAQVSLEPDARSTGGTPLSEMSLDELSTHLAGMQDTIRDMQAIESSSVALPNQGSDQSQPSPAEPAPGT